MEQPFLGGTSGLLIVDLQESVISECLLFDLVFIIGRFNWTFKSLTFMDFIIVVYVFL